MTERTRRGDTGDSSIRYDDDPYRFAEDLSYAIVNQADTETINSIVQAGPDIDPWLINRAVVLACVPDRDTLASILVSAFPSDSTKSFVSNLDRYCLAGLIAARPDKFAHAVSIANADPDILKEALLVGVSDVQPFQPSDRLKTMLLAYTQCKDALDIEALDIDSGLKERVAQSSFWMGVVSYYSAFRGEKDSERFQGRLGQKKLLDDSALMTEVFDEFRRLRNRKLAHKVARQEGDNAMTWLRVTPMVAGPDRWTENEFYMNSKSFPSLSEEKKRGFVELVSESVNIISHDDGIPFYRRRHDGTVSLMPRPKS